MKRNEMSESSTPCVIYMFVNYIVRNPTDIRDEKEGRGREAIDLRARKRKRARKKEGKQIERKKNHGDNRKLIARRIEERN